MNQCPYCQKILLEKEKCDCYKTKTSNYYFLIIATKRKVTLNKNIDALCLNNNCTLIDDHHIKHLDNIYEFEYLIYSDLSEVHFLNENLIMKENNIPITNFYYQTSLEHIYYITEDNLVQKINDIINNE